MKDKKAEQAKLNKDMIGFVTGCAITVAFALATIVFVLSKRANITYSARFFEDGSEIPFYLLNEVILVILLLGVLIFWLYYALSRRRERLMEIQEQVYSVTVEEAEQRTAFIGAARNDYMSYISKDIKRYAGSIQSCGEMILEKNGDFDAVEITTKRLLSSTIALSFLVKNVTKVGQIEAGEYKPAKDLIDMKDTINAIYPEIAEILDEREVSFSLGQTDISHVSVLGDAQAIQLVLENVIVNALDFIKADGHITLGAKEIVSGADEASFCFVISDDGVGMSDTYLEHVFTLNDCKYGNLRSACREIGLNMAVARKLIYDMGGSIKAESVEGQGTHIFITIPMGLCEKAVDDQFLGGMRILVVEDNELNLEVTKYLLEEKGVIVSQASNGQEAIDVFASSDPGTYDVIIMDVMMPVMDGLTATKKIRALERLDAQTVSIIAMTANGRSQDVEDVLLSGMNAHLMKPVKPEELFGVLIQCRNLQYRNRES